MACYSNKREIILLSQKAEVHRYYRFFILYISNIFISKTTKDEIHIGHHYQSNYALFQKLDK